MGCTEEAIQNKKPLLPAEWESFKNLRERKRGPFEAENICADTYTASRSILAHHYTPAGIPTTADKDTTRQ